MRILVIDDKQANIDAAIMQLGDDHEVVTATSYDEAERYIAGIIPHVSANGRWEHVGYQNPIKEGDVRTEYELRKHHFDVILTDLFLPASQRAKVSNPSLGEEPLGLIIAMASMRMGIPVAIVSTGGHHHNPFCWAMDLLGTGYHGENPYLIGNIPFVFSTDTANFKVSDEGQYGTRGKSWNKALDGLLSIMEKPKQSDQK